MADDPTSSGGDGPGEATREAPDSELRPSDSQSHGDAYQWYGPSGQASPAPGHEQQAASGSQPYGQQPLYGHGGPYGQQPPYGHEGPYGPPHHYGQAGPYAQQPYTYDPSGSSQNPYDPQQHGGHRYSWPFIPPPPPRAPRTPEERRKRNRRAMAFTGVLVLAVGAGIGIGAAIAPTSPVTVAKALVSSTIAATKKAGSYHYAELSTFEGAHDDIKGDAGANDGSQVILERCKGGTNLFDLRLVHGVVYFRGNDLAVLDQLGVSSARAGTVTDKWVKVVKGEKLYASFADGITTSSNIGQLHTTFDPTSSKHVSGSSPPYTEVTGPLVFGKRSVGAASLEIDASSGLPEKLQGSASGTSGRITMTWTFDAFGKKVAVAAPGGALSYTSLQATPPKSSTCI